eukprot:TRINITY_DN3061_c0_g1_i1.p1 TRINITY_DN3061_c0_g1~~TRINITY_DN3061_c0_g1_i1.p1  ORF type:complete len:411 (-),score=67.06 TRINITY_DN3061_c0_g1_i1:224-1456(-)
MGSSASAFSRVVVYKDKKVKDLNKVDNIDLLASFSKLETIDLHKNKISTIPPAVCADFRKNEMLCQTLVEINLAHNRLTELPDEFYSLINLKILVLDHNILTEISPKLTAFYRLEVLSLTHNKIAHIPWSISKLKQLQKLLIDENLIDYLPNSMGKMKLTTFHVAANPLREIPQEVRNTFKVSLKGASSGFGSSAMVKSTGVIENPDNPADLLKAIKKQQMNLRYKKEYEEDTLSRIEKRNLVYPPETSLLRAVLKDKKGRELMMLQMQKEHCSENFEFWNKILKFRNKYSSDEPIILKDLQSEAQQIFNEFISEQSKYTINLPSSIITSLKKLFDQYSFPKGINQWVFDDAFREINCLMSRDVFLRFRMNADAKELVEKSQKALDKEKAKIEQIKSSTPTVSSPTLHSG